MTGPCALVLYIWAWGKIEISPEINMADKDVGENQYIEGRDKVKRGKKRAATTPLPSDESGPEAEEPVKPVKKGEYPD